jgi:hypothetical protein
MTTDSIKSKIAALLAKAESTENEFEADAFMAKVNELLEKHQIEMHEVRQARDIDTDPMGHQDGETNLYASIKWARDLAGGLARYYGCKFIYWRRNNHFAYEIIGRESARTTFELMLPFIISQVRIQARRCYGINTMGKTLAIWEREVGQALWLRVLKLATTNDIRRADLESKALVPVNMAEVYFNNRHPDCKTDRNIQLKFGQTARDAADKVSLHHQATGRHTKLLAAH